MISKIWIKLSDWLKIGKGRGILIYSAGQGLNSKPINLNFIALPVDVLVVANSVDHDLETKHFDYCLLCLPFSQHFWMGFSGKILSFKIVMSGLASGVVQGLPFG